MTQRIDYATVFPEARKGITAIVKATHGAGLESSLLHLVFLRSSQLNGCAYCINLHTQDALKEGERPVRLYTIDAWREAGLFNERERAALALTEAMTLIWKDHVPDEVYDAAATQFSEKELAALMLAVVQINIFNRLSVTAQRPPAIQPA